MMITKVVVDLSWAAAWRGLVPSQMTTLDQKSTYRHPPRKQHFSDFLNRLSPILFHSASHSVFPVLFHSLYYTFPYFFQLWTTPCQVPGSDRANCTAQDTGRISMDFHRRCSLMQEWWAGSDFKLCNELGMWALHEWSVTRTVPTETMFLIIILYFIT